jgi:hypothetical protein
LDDDSPRLVNKRSEPDLRFGEKSESLDAKKPDLGDKER